MASPPSSEMLPTIKLSANATLPPFPKELATIELPRISLSKLRNNVEAESKMLFDICGRTGFFYLNLMDDSIGKEYWEDAIKTREVGKVMSTLSMEDKDKFKKRPEVGILDRGFQSTIRDENGKTKFNESCNIPRDELFTRTYGDSESSFCLPPWLHDHRSLFEDLMAKGTNIANVILGILELHLQLPEGTINSCHKLSDPSHSFIRILRYPGLEPGKTLGGRFFAHRDIVTIAILITWLGGLQIPKEDAVIDEINRMPTEDSWRWVKPLEGHAIVNLGDAMSIFTNDRLKSGLHRIVTAPGKQAEIDRYSVLLGTRAAHETPMKAFESPLIPMRTPNPVVLTCKQWGDKCVKDFIEAEVKKVRSAA